MLRRFWFEFIFPDPESAPGGMLMGCGVTAGSKEEAVTLLKVCIFEEGQFPHIRRCIEDVDIRSLDQNHVVPNMGDPVRPGIWFPLGYQV